MIIAFTGAGISKASGIPTFEDQGDLRTKLSRTYYNTHREDYNNIINTMIANCNKAKPNDAHLALAEFDIPVITMNVDGLHQRAGTKNVWAIHGNLPNIVLYGDPAPLYSDALSLMDKMCEEDILLIVGVSGYTRISEEIERLARLHGASIVKINKNAENDVRTFLNNNKSHMGDFDEFDKRNPYY